MLIDLRELLSDTRDELVVTADIDMSVMNTGVSDYAILKKSPFELKLHKPGKNKVSVKCEGSVVLDIPCDRCLESVPTGIDFAVDELVDLDKTDSKEEEQEEKDYIDGYNLDVDKLIFGEILLSMPGKTLCKENCKGLCLVCGSNLNVAECGCDRSSLDPRMSVFKDILNNFKEV